MNNQSSNRSIIIWLWTIIFMVFCMIFIGGITRLTDSGLSMVNWRPLMGAIPPLNHEEWMQTFNAYRAFPEYKLINAGMSLSEFKMIFFWEYFHRLFGRLIGVAFFFPFLYFVVKKRMSVSLIKKVSIAFVLGGMQGLMGWYMVKSGLVDKPDVSHFRLAAHLDLAFLIIGYIYWIILGLKNRTLVKAHSSKMRTWLVAFLCVLCFQITYGAFVAGMDAGLSFNTFPKMGQRWIPNDSFMLSPVILNYVENTALIQFIHRTLAWLLLLAGLFLCFKSRSITNLKSRRAIQMMGVSLAVQFVLGVVTLLLYIPVSIASMHQIGACVLLLLTLRAIFYTSRSTL